MPSPVNMVQDRTINIASVPPQSVPLPATTSANSPQSLSSSQNSTTSLSQTSTSSSTTASVNSSSTGSSTPSSQTSSTSTVTSSPQKVNTSPEKADNSNTNPSSTNTTVPAVSTTTAKPAVQANGTIEPVNPKPTPQTNKDESKKEVSTQPEAQANQVVATVTTETKISKKIVVEETINDNKKEAEVKSKLNLIYSRYTSFLNK